MYWSHFKPFRIYYWPFYVFIHLWIIPAKIVLVQIVLDVVPCTLLYLFSEQQATMQMLRIPNAAL
jgi:hypothetical protein